MASLLVIAAGLALGSTVVMTRLAVHEIPPFMLTAIRLVITCTAFVPTLVILHRRFPKSRRRLFDIGLVGLALTAIPLVTFTTALLYVSSGVLSTFIATIPIFTAALAHQWLAHERLTVPKLGGLLFGFGGVLVLYLTRTTGLGELAFDIRGPLLALVGVVFSAVAAVYTRLRLREVDPLVVTAGQFFTSLVFIGPIALLLEPVSLQDVTLPIWGAVIYASLVGSYLGFVLFFLIVHRYGATTAALVSYVMPVTSGVLGAFILGEVITAPMVAGAALTFAGIVLVSR